MNIIHSLHLPSISGLGLQFYHATQSLIYPPKVFPAHTHSGVEIYILEEGETAFQIEKEQYDLTAGDAVFALSGEIHNCIIFKETPHRHYCFWLDAAVMPLLEGMSGFCGHERRISLSAEGKTELLAHCAALQAAAEAEDELLALAWLLRMLHLLGGIPQDKTEEKYPNQLREILGDIEQNFAVIHGLSYFTEKYFISPSTLNRLFRRHLGVSPRRYIETLRLERARFYLNSGKNVSEAGAAVGFTDCSGFIRLFRARFGITPAAYRRLGNGGVSLQLYVNKEL